VDGARLRIAAAKGPQAGLPGMPKPGNLVLMKAPFLACAVLWMLGPVPAHADDASKMAKIEEMLQLTHADRIVGQMLAQMQPAMAAQLKKMNLPEDSQAMAEEVQKKLMEWMAGKLSWEKLKPIYIKVYMDTFSEEEIAGVLEFYKTPAGQALLNKMPQLIQKTITLTQQMMGDMIPELNKMTEEIVSKYKKQ
jgi:hypothetical protein